MKPSKMTRLVALLVQTFVLVSVTFRVEGFLRGIEPENDLNDQPLIGILSQPLYHSLPNVSFIAASYVQYVELAGARAIPIVYTDSREEIIRRFKAVNGLILPGGTVGLDASSAQQYDDVARMLYQLAFEENQRGDPFPVHGFCMGFQMLMRFSAEREQLVLTKGFDSVDHPNELEWTDKAETSRLVGGNGISKVFRDRMAAVPPVVIENHHQGVLIETFGADEKLKRTWDVLSMSTDRAGRKYISTVEGKGNLMFSGTQWHPEKNAFEWKSKSIPHSPEAVGVTQYMANKFVEVARLSKHRPVSEEMRDELIIWNNPPIYHSPLVRDFELIFVYGPHEHSEIRKHTKYPSIKLLDEIQVQMLNLAERNEWLY